MRWHGIRRAGPAYLLSPQHQQMEADMAHAASPLLLELMLGVYTEQTAEVRVSTPGSHDGHIRPAAEGHRGSVAMATGL